MAAATRSQALSPPRVRWRPMLSNAGLAGLFTLFVVANGASLLDQPRLSIGLLIVFQATIVGLAIVRRAAPSAPPSPPPTRWPTAASSPAPPPSATSPPSQQRQPPR